MKVGRGSRGGGGRDGGGGVEEERSGGVEAAPPVKRRRVAVAPSAGAGGSRRVQAEASPLQRLFRACRAVFRGTGTVPAPGEVDLLCSMLGESPLSFFHAVHVPVYHADLAGFFLFVRACNNLVVRLLVSTCFVEL
jgi:hypothetical protein